LPCPGPSGAATAKTEEILKYISKAGKNIFESAKASEPSSFKALMPEAVIDLPFFPVSQNFVGFGGLFKAFFSLLVTRVSIGISSSPASREMPRTS
jgi:hypothetical protein